MFSLQPTQIQRLALLTILGIASPAAAGIRLIGSERQVLVAAPGNYLALGPQLKFGIEDDPDATGAALRPTPFQVDPNQAREVDPASAEEESEENAEPVSKRMVMYGAPSTSEETGLLKDLAKIGPGILYPQPPLGRYWPRYPGGAGSGSRGASILETPVEPPPTEPTPEPASLAIWAVTAVGASLSLRRQKMAQAS